MVLNDGPLIIKAEAWTTPALVDDNWFTSVSVKKFVAFKFLIIPDDNIYAVQNATNLFLKLINLNIDTTINTNIFTEFNQRMKDYNYKNYHTIIVSENSYYYMNESNKIISMDEIMKLSV